MDFRKIFIALIIFSLSNLFALSQDEIRLKIMTKYSNCKTFQAEFFQLNYWPSYDKSNKSSGNIYFNSKKMILKYKDPKQYLFVNSDSLLIYNVETNQVMISKQTGLFSDFKINNILKKYWKKDNSEIRISGKNIKVILNLNEDGIKIITLLFDEKYNLKKIKFIDSESNEISLKFNKLKLNGNLPKNIFNMKIPKNANIIRR